MATAGGSNRMAHPRSPHSPIFLRMTFCDMNSPKVSEFREAKSPALMRRIVKGSGMMGVGGLPFDRARFLVPQSRELCGRRHR